MKTANINTSIGPIYIEVEESSWFTVETVDDATPRIYLIIDRQYGRWQKPRKPTFYNGDPMPATLAKELFTLATEWADSHPEVFERAAGEEFDGLVSYIVHDSFDQVQAILRSIERDVTKVLEGNDYSGEFARQAPPKLRELVENAAKMLHATDLQLDAAREAIRETAAAHTGRQIVRPGGPGSRGFFQEAEMTGQTALSR